ncbi:MAG: hypothetical protein ACOX2K_00195 [Bacillota bacterium]
MNRRGIGLADPSFMLKEPVLPSVASKLDSEGACAEFAQRQDGVLQRWGKAAFRKDRDCCGAMTGSALVIPILAQLSAQLAQRAHGLDLQRLGLGQQEAVV